MCPRCSEPTFSGVVVCPADAGEGTVLLCTSGDEHTEPRARLACQMMHSLGWMPHVIRGTAEEAFPPESRKIGCRGSRQLGGRLVASPWNI